MNNNSMINPIKFNFTQNLKKRFLFEEYKKKKQFLSLTSKDKIIKTIKEQETTTLRLWEANRIVRTFNLHSLYRPMKLFYPQNLNRLSPDCHSFFRSRYQLFAGQIYHGSSGFNLAQQNFRKVLNEFFRPNFKKKHLYIKENITLSKKFQNREIMTVNVNQKKKFKVNSFGSPN